MLLQEQTSLLPLPRRLSSNDFLSNQAEKLQFHKAPVILINDPPLCSTQNFSNLFLSEQIVKCLLSPHRGGLRLTAHSPSSTNQRPVSKSCDHPQPIRGYTAGHCEGQAKKNASLTFSMEKGSLGCPESG